MVAQTWSSRPYVLLQRLDSSPSLGFIALVDRMLRVQSAVGQLLARHESDMRLGHWMRRARTSNAYVIGTLKAVSGATVAPSGRAADRWLLRLLAVRDDPIRCLVHGISAHLHDLGTDNLARRLASRFVAKRTLGDPSPVRPLRANELLALPLFDKEQAYVADELERVVDLQRALCTEVHDQFIA